MSDPRRLIVTMGLLMGLSSAAGLWLGGRLEGLLAPLATPAKMLEDHLKSLDLVYLVCGVYGGFVLAAAMVAWIRDVKEISYPLFVVVTLGSLTGALLFIPK